MELASVFQQDSFPVSLNKQPLISGRGGAAAAEVSGIRDNINRFSHRHHGARSKAVLNPRSGNLPSGDVDREGIGVGQANELLAWRRFLIDGENFQGRAVRLSGWDSGSFQLGVRARKEECAATGKVFIDACLSGSLPNN